MQELMNLLNKYKITPNQMVLLHCIQASLRPSTLIPNIMEEAGQCQKMGFLTPDKQLSQLALGLLSEADKLFKNNRKKKILFDTPEFAQNLMEYRMLFPAGLLPSGKPARTNMNELKKKMTDFFIANPSYDWDLVLDATTFYVEHYRKQNYNFMKTSGFFINKNGESDLAANCEMILEGADVTTIKKSQYNIA